MENGDYLTYFISSVVSISFITMLAACLCCRKKVPKNELLGLEGMVKIKNPDEHLVNGSSLISSEPNPKTGGSEVDSKRASNAPHRSLPDIPISDPNQLDTGSDLYATVGDKVTGKPHGRSPTSSLKKQVSVSQHSSISQADDLSSPYARVRSPLHAYDKVRPAEHPYAQLKMSGTGQNSGQHGNASTSNDNIDGSLMEEDSLSRRGSHQSLLDAVDNHQQQVIPAASAIAGRVSASQELPYMTPPIVQPQQHFSGDSQDSSKGYTSISVREPLANIIAQTNKQNAQARRRDISDSHYATVSDDSDEMYAAIDDPNNQADLYTSGSETYAQIQPHVAPLTVAVEINTTSASSTNGEQPQPATPPLSNIPLSNYSMANGVTISTVSSPRHSVIANVYMDEQPPLPPVEILKAAHSRQASSSSCTSSVGNLGSPKPEKRQANSPLPPTPKIPHQYLSNSNLTNSSSATSGRNSAASVIDCHVLNIGSGGSSITPSSLSTHIRQMSRENLSASDSNNRNVNTSVIRLTEKNATVGDADEPRKKNRMSKDLEGMYAKVMKKTKLSNAPSQNTSPIPHRKSMNDSSDNGTGMFLSDPDITRELLMPELLSKSVHASPGKNSARSAHATIDNDYETIDKRRACSSNCHYDQKDPGYETIPGDKLEASVLTKSMKTSRASAPPGALSHVNQNATTTPLDTFSDPNYTINSEPGYESLTDQSLLTNDPGYETVQGNSNSRKSNSDYDPNYEVLRPIDGDGSSAHYAKVWDNKMKMDANDGYSSIKVQRKSNTVGSDDDVPGYCTIASDAKAGYSTIGATSSASAASSSSKAHHDYASISESTKRNYFKNSALVTDEDVYSSIPTDSSVVVVGAGGSNGGAGSSLIPPTPSPTVASPSSNIMQISGYSTISETKTITSLSSVSDGGNSSDTPIDYNRVRSANDLSQITHSTYESLTGSESDPNYESVRYLNVQDKENPYERLHNEKGSSPEPNTKSSGGNSGSGSAGGGVGSASEKNSSTSSILTINDSSDAGDYFQV